MQAERVAAQRQLEDATSKGEEDVRKLTQRNKALLSQIEGLSEDLERARAEVSRLKMQYALEEASKAALEKERATLQEQLARL